MLLSRILLGLFILGIILCVISLLNGFHLYTLLFYCTVTVISGILLLILKPGNVITISAILPLLLFGISLTASYLSGGIQSPAFSSFLLVIILTFFLFGERLGIIAAVTSVAIGVVWALLEQ